MDSERIEPNMTPILDMVFQLITFFMMVINFRATDFNREVDLPIVGSAAPTNEQVVTDMLVLNVRSDGTVISRGERQAIMDSFAKEEMKRFQILQRKTNPSELDVSVIVRADRTLPYGMLSKVVDSCKAAGFSKFEFVVMRKVKEAAAGEP